jgi:hypothetical protein
MNVERDSVAVNMCSVLVSGVDIDVDLSCECAEASSCESGPVLNIEILTVSWPRMAYYEYSYRCTVFWLLLVGLRTSAERK